MAKLILSAAFGYQADVLRPFLLSANEFIPDATVVLFRDRKDLSFERQVKEYNRRCEIMIIPYSSSRRLIWNLPKRLRKPISKILSLQGRNLIQNPNIYGVFLHLVLSRFLYYEQYLKKYSKKSDQVILTDSRDVVFQGNPFPDIKRNILIGIEDLVVYRSRRNSEWLKYYYPNTVYDKLKNYNVICAGVILGSCERILEFLGKLKAEAEMNISRTFFKHGIDQAILNKLYYVDKWPIDIVPTGSPTIATIGAYKLEKIEFSQAKGLTSSSGAPIKIIHQYDRIKELASWYHNRYCI